MKTHRFLKKSVRFLFSLFYPECCPLCGNEPPMDGSPDMFCKNCLMTMQFIHGKPCPVCGGDINGIFDICPDCLAEPKRKWNHAYAVFRYNEGAAEAVRKFKYGNETALAKPFGKLMAGVIPDPEQYAEIIPVPLHWIRFLQRGYNQSVLLGEELSRHTHIPLSRRLKRIRNTKHQAFLEKDARKKNIKGAFSVRKPEEIKGKRVLLIDDVMTTGSTLAECADILTKAGAIVDVAVIARRQTRL